LFTIDGAGNLSNAGSLTIATAITAGSTIYTPGTVQGGYVHSTGNADVGGTLGVVGTANVGGLFSSGGVLGTTGVFTSGGCGIYQGSGYSIVQWEANWVDYFSLSSGYRYWSNGGGVGSNIMQLDPGGTLTLNTGNLVLNVGGGFNYTSPYWNVLSDERMKKNVTPYSAGLAEVLALEPVTFQWNGQQGTPDDGVIRHGLIAQATQKVMPEMVIDMDAFKLEIPAGQEPMANKLGMDMTPLPLALVNAVKALNARIEALEAEVAALRK
jgi:hypothetical protein